jgi:hypothetical protein
MTRKETTAIALKCFAIYFLSQAFFAFPALTALGLKLKYMGAGKPSNIWVVVIPTLGAISCVIVAFLIWKSTNSLMTKETTPENPTSDIRIDDVVKIIFACMGVYFIIHALIALPYALINYRMITKNYPPFTYLPTQVIELFFGALLVAKPGQWVKAIRSIGKF